MINKVSIYFTDINFIMYKITIIFSVKLIRGLCGIMFWDLLVIISYFVPSGTLCPMDVVYVSNILVTPGFGIS